MVNAVGLMIAVHFKDYATNKCVIDALVAGPAEELGVFTDWFLFADNALRIAPPLNINVSQINTACDLIIKAINKLT